VYLSGIQRRVVLLFAGENNVGRNLDVGYLFQPGFTRYGIESGDIVALPFTMQLQSEYKKMIREKDAQIEALEAELKRFKEKPKAKVYLLKNHLL